MPQPSGSSGSENGSKDGPPDTPRPDSPTIPKPLPPIPSPPPPNRHGRLRNGGEGDKCGTRETCKKDVDKSKEEEKQKEMEEAQRVRKDWDMLVKGGCLWRD